MDEEEFLRDIRRSVSRTGSSSQLGRLLQIYDRSVDRAKGEGSVLAKAREHGYREGYLAARGEAVERVTEIMKAYCEEPEVDNISDKIQLLRHVRAVLKTLSNKRVK